MAIFTAAGGYVQLKYTSGAHEDGYDKDDLMNPDMM